MCLLDNQTAVVGLCFRRNDVIEIVLIGFHLFKTDPLLGQLAIDHRVDAFDIRPAQGKWVVSLAGLDYLHVFLLIAEVTEPKVTKLNHAVASQVHTV